MAGMAVTAPRRRPGARPGQRAGRRPPVGAPVPDSVRAGAEAATVTEHAGASLPPRLPRWRGAEGPDRILSGPEVDPSAPALTCRERYKRPFDLVALALAVVALGPLWLVLGMAIAAAIRLQDGGRVLYRQARLGRGGRIFAMLKFRTLAEDAERDSGPVWAQPGDVRSTAVGRVLRRFHLDELPQVVHVLRGEMSLVGPRPERPELAPRIERGCPGFARRLAVRPGIAGLAQARGRWRGSPRNKLRYDLVYIGAMGPWLDIRLCAACVWRALRGTRDGRARPGREAPARHAGVGQAQMRRVIGERKPCRGADG